MQGCVSACLSNSLCFSVCLSALFGNLTLSLNVCPSFLLLKTDRKGGKDPALD